MGSLVNNYLRGIAIDLVMFKEEYLPQAAELLAARHRNERRTLSELPVVFESKDAAFNAVKAAWKRENASGVAAIRDRQLVGYIIGRLVTDIHRGRHAWFRLGFAHEQVHALLELSHEAVEVEEIEGIEVRLADKSDVEAIKNISTLIMAHQVGSPVWAIPGFPEELEEFRQGYAELLDDESVRLWTAFRGEKLVGFQSFWPKQGFKPIAYRLTRKIDPRILWVRGIVK